MFNSSLPLCRRLLVATLCLQLISGCTPAPPPASQANSEPPALPPAVKVLIDQQQRTRSGAEPAPETATAAKRLAGRPLEQETPSPTNRAVGMVLPSQVSDQVGSSKPIQLNSESYSPYPENSFINAANDPLSTFSIDVDTASYANIRRFLNEGSLPPAGAVRIEEMLNYFRYDSPQPESGPIALQAEVGPAPWHQGHQLVKIGLQARDLPAEKLPPSNLVFLIDVSGSMQDENKLPLLQQSMLLLIDELTASDRVAIVVYAGSERVVLDPTPGDQKERIRQAIRQLTAGGSTHASSGIVTAYRLAEQVFMPQGNNRVILASDGDFNVGVTDRGELKRLISDKRSSGIYLTVLGFGMGNYHDDTMELLADSGNGNYAYIDSLLEAKKVLIKERAATLFALARDVKLQIEFNPARVGAYRLIGYENRLLADEDFRDDRKDAGEIGLGHAVTALYELIPAGSRDIPAVDERRYTRNATAGSGTAELLTVKLRYKPEGRETSEATALVVPDSRPRLDQTSADFQFAAAVAGFGMLLKHSAFSGDWGYPALLELARAGRGPDHDGYRAEFIRLVEMAELL